MATSKKRSGRPRKEVDMALVGRLAKIQCTEEEIASVIGCSVDTLARQENFAEVYKKNKDGGKQSLRRMQWKIAETNPTMAIWLGKQYLGQTDKVETVTDTSVTFVNDVPKIGKPNGD